MQDKQEDITEEQLIEIEQLFKNKKFMQEDFEKSLWDGRMQSWLQSQDEQTKDTLWIPFWWCILHPKPGETVSHLPTTTSNLDEKLSQLVNTQKLQHDSIRIDLISLLFSYLYVQYLFNGCMSLPQEKLTTEQTDSVYSALLLVCFFSDYMVEHRQHFGEIEEWITFVIEKSNMQNFKLWQGLDYSFHILEELYTLLLICDEKSINLAPILEVPLNELENKCILLAKDPIVKKSDKKKIFLLEKKIHFLRLWIRDVEQTIPKQLMVQLQETTQKHKTLWDSRKSSNQEEKFSYTNPYYNDESV